MSILLTRPYPVQHLPAAARAIREATSGRMDRLHTLYLQAAQALEEMDPDELDELRLGYGEAPRSDRAAARAAIEVADGWEGVVAVGATITDPRRFRGFAWMAGHTRYLDTPPSPADMARYMRGANPPQTTADDAALFAALPALIGLGPELPEEIRGPCPLPGEPVYRILGLPEGDWSGIDPLDGLAIAPEVCLRHLAGLSPAWRALVERCADRGLLVRAIDGSLS